MSLNPSSRGVRRISLARTGRVPVDHNGRPLAPPTTFEYDEDGHLIRVVPAEVPKPRDD